MRTCITALLFSLFLPVSALAADLFVPLASATGDAMSAEADSLSAIRDRRTTLRVETVGINIDALDGGGDVNVDLPTARGVNARVKKIDRRGARDFIWYGELPGTPGSAILVVRDGKVTGTIRNDKELYRILSIGGDAHALIQIDERAFPQDHPHGMDNGANPPGKMPAAKAQDSAAAVGEPIIDVLVAYTERAKNAAGDIKGLIDLAIAETNEGYENSGINPRVRLVGTRKVDYNERGKSFDTVVSHLRGKTDKHMKNIHAQRDEQGADVVLLIINNDDSCGIADRIMASESTAFAVGHWDCVTGYYTFGHEIGHLQGARHDPSTDSTNTPFAYGHGYRHRSAWRTVLAYDCSDGCPRVLQFSNPDVNYNGNPTGNTSRSNNARVINETANIVSGWRATVVLP
jgi:peptidyl-Asp metalloendopeptidase